MKYMHVCVHSYNLRVTCTCIEFFFTHATFFIYVSHYICIFCSSTDHAKMFYVLYFYLTGIAIADPKRKPFCRVRIFLVRKLTFLKPADQIDKYSS
jgi:hypothetical protein